MSRNLCTTTCDECDSEIEVEEPPRPITREEAGVYFAEFEGMHVANAHCPKCRTKYLAWFTRRSPFGDLRLGEVGSEHNDLSYRSSFDDEPGESDLDPSFQWDRAKQKVKDAISILEREEFRAKLFGREVVSGCLSRVPTDAEAKIAELREHLLTVASLFGKESPRSAPRAAPVAPAAPAKKPPLRQRHHTGRAR